MFFFVNYKYFLQMVTPLNLFGNKLVTFLVAMMVIYI